MSKAVATKGNTDVAVSEVEALLGNSAVSGFDEASQDNFAIPFIRILQSNSPQCKKSDGAYIKGAEEGDLFHTVGQHVIPGAEGIEVVPVYFRETWNEWVPRNDGGGLVAVHPITSNIRSLAEEIENSEGKRILKLPNGNELIQTVNHYVLAYVNDVWEPCVISMQSSNLTVSRKWMSNMRALRMQVGGKTVARPMFGSIYKITTTVKTDDTNSWYIFAFSRQGDVTEASLVQMSLEYIEGIKAGTHREDVNSAAATDGGAVDGDIPF